MAKSSRLFVIDPGIKKTEFASYDLITKLSPITTSFHLLAKQDVQTIWNAEQTFQCSGIIILGSIASVHEWTSWQKELMRWIESEIEAQTPILGICYGHQLLAYMHGAEVVSCGSEFVGFRNVELLEDTTLKFEKRKVPLFFAHNEKVRQVPSDFELLAQSDLHQVEGLRHKNLPIWSFQAHIEATETFARNNKFENVDEFPKLTKGNEILEAFLKQLR